MARTEQPMKITKVDASLNELTELEIESLKPFLNVKSIDFSLNRISRVCNLGSFRSLVSINLSHNKLTDIAFLSAVTAVVELNLSMNEIGDITGLSSLNSLTTLHINDNQLTSLDGVQSLPYLRELHIQRNKIESLLPLTANRHLACVNAAHNRIDSLRGTISTIQYLDQLKSIILYGNPMEGDADYPSALMRMESLTSVDNVTLKKDLSYLAFKSEPENMNNLKDAARQAFWNQLTLRRNHMEENVRFLQQRILQQQEEFRDYEAKLKTDMETTMLHLDGLTLDVTNLPSQPVITPRSVITPPAPTPWKPVVPSQAASDQMDYLPSSRKPHRGLYKGVTDTDEILRLASTELSQEHRPRNGL